jgi:hypothetical protein
MSIYFWNSLYIFMMFFIRQKSLLLEFSLYILRMLFFVRSKALFIIIYHSMPPLTKAIFNQGVLIIDLIRFESDLIRYNPKINESGMDLFFLNRNGRVGFGSIQPINYIF